MKFKNPTYETLPGKEFAYVLPITSILGRLPVVQAGDTGTIPFTRPLLLWRGFGAHCYNDDLAEADTSSGAGDGNSWALGWSSDP